ncbi:MAG: coenzyme F420-0:L-glutamate ligase [Anaerolineales bacterium]|nr:coenzyme F420-0:L-glutamate ligase [Anaerolineae bacterium]PWB77885.1 MAG: coenzyme F420-0:L-glutamate ligase [Anaerolineales bacterium]
MQPLTLTPLKNIPLIRRDDNLADIIVTSLRDSNIQLQDGDILVLAQKIVSKAEGRTVDLATVTPSPRARELAEEIQKDARLIELILQESNEVLRTRIGTIIVEHKLGFVCANAGIDHSNVNPPLPRTEQSDSGDEAPNPEDWVLLLPTDPDRSAEKMRTDIASKTGKRVGILIIDSHGRAWRNGTVGCAIGIAGMPGLQDLRGTPDLFGFTLRITQVGVADELAAAASLVMGQAAEGKPVVHVRGFPYSLRDGSLKELIRPKEQDLFR